ncbi:hypothetical protein WA026_015894 [Henosepilachna vigintioctopunctata]|uniref:Uncharacterized protein n=1 Tax=Henosepilachna vigintioctopunctata TaxID=420089 RepID=A0AAW1UZ47_9CUCU
MNKIFLILFGVLSLVLLTVQGVKDIHLATYKPPTPYPTRPTWRFRRGIGNSRIPIDDGKLPPRIPHPDFSNQPRPRI